VLETSPAQARVMLDRVDISPHEQEKG